MRLNLLGVAVLSVAASALLAGCSTSFAPGPETPVQTEFGPIGGQVYGGQQPVVGGAMYAYQTSTVAYGGPGIADSTANASTSLIQSGGVTGYTAVQDSNGNYYVPTDANGGFEISASTTCTSGTVVYLYMLGGEPTLNTPNANAGELAVLGVCPANGLLVNSVVATGTSAHIFMNEVSTVAAAYALAGFASDATHIGALTTATVGGPVTDTLAQTGIQNAAANAAQLFTDVGGNGSSNAANATTPNGNGPVPQSEIDSIANVLAACINSSGAVVDGSYGSSKNVCNELFDDNKPNGVEATDTASAAIDFAQQPYFKKVADVFNLAGSSPPFSPALSVAPNDFSITLAFTGGGLATSSAHASHSLAVDGSGGVWSVNPGANTLSKFNSLGVPSSASGYSGNGLSDPYSVAIGTDSLVYVMNNTTYTGSIFTLSGSADLTKGAPQIQGPTDVELDVAGNLWIINDGGSGETASVSIVDPALDSIVATSTAITTPSAVALGYQYAFVADSGTDQMVYFNGNNETISSTGYHTTTNPTIGIATDSTGSRAWATETSTYITRSGVIGSGDGFTEKTLAATGQYKTPTPLGIAIDGYDDLWVSDTANGAIYQATDSGVVSNGSFGFPALGNSAGAAPTVQPAAVAVDGSGNVWYNTLTDSKLYEIVGAGSPVATPLAYGVANNLIASLP